MSSFKRAVHLPSPSGSAASKPLQPLQPDDGSVSARKVAAAPVLTSIPGTRKWLDGSLLLSTGHAQLDAIFGGGVQAGSVVLLEEDCGGIHARTLAQLFAAEGAAAGHNIIVSGHDGRTSPADFLAGLPLNVSRGSRDLLAVQGAAMSAGSAEGIDVEVVGLKNAWQYRKYMPSGDADGGAGISVGAAVSGGPKPAVSAVRTVSGSGGGAAPPQPHVQAQSGSPRAGPVLVPPPAPLAPAVPTPPKYCNTFDLGRRMPPHSLQATHAIVLPSVAAPPLLTGLPPALEPASTGRKGVLRGSAGTRVSNASEAGRGEGADVDHSSRARLIDAVLELQDLTSAAMQDKGSVDPCSMDLEDDDGGFLSTLRMRALRLTISSAVRDVGLPCLSAAASTGIVGAGQGAHSGVGLGGGGMRRASITQRAPSPVLGAGAVAGRTDCAQGPVGAAVYPQLMDALCSILLPPPALGCGMDSGIGVARAAPLLHSSTAGVPGTEPALLPTPPRLGHASSSPLPCLVTVPAPRPAAVLLPNTAMPTRVLLLGLGGPHWHGFQGSDAYTGMAVAPAGTQAMHNAYRPFLQSLARLRRIVDVCSGPGLPGAVAVVTVPTWCMPLAVAAHARLHAHIVVKLHAFGEPAYALATTGAPRASSQASAGTAPEFSSYSGLLLVRRCSRPGCSVPVLPETLTWLFKRDKRKMAIEQPHLPPEGEGHSGRDTGTAPDNPALASGPVPATARATYPYPAATAATAALLAHASGEDSWGVLIGSGEEEEIAASIASAHRTAEPALAAGTGTVMLHARSVPTGAPFPPVPDRGLDAKGDKQAAPTLPFDYDEEPTQEGNDASTSGMLQAGGAQREERGTGAMGGHAMGCASAGGRGGGVDF